jgi:TolC family type I secretion outer membrane protein
LLCYILPTAQATDLLTCYRLAFDKEANFQAARAATEAAREQVPQALSQLLPNLSASASKSRVEASRTPPYTPENPMHYLSSSYVIALRQPLFRYQSWANYQQASAKALGAEADLDKERQNLGLKIAQSYFQALFAQDLLAAAQAQKDAYEGELAAAKLSFKVGTGTRTDIDEAQAQFDTARARELEARQSVEYAFDELSSLTGQPIAMLSPLDGNKFLEPLDKLLLEEWQTRVAENNPELISRRQAVQAAELEIDKAKAGHLPNVDLVAQRSLQDSDTFNTINQRINSSQFGLQVNLPIYSGGYQNSAVRQAYALLDQARFTLEAARQAAFLQLKKRLQSLSEGSERIKALETALYSAEQLIVSSKKGIQAGTRNTIDLLNAIQKRAATYQDLAQARYTYVLDRVQLFSLTGTLNDEMLGNVNRWLN